MRIIRLFLLGIVMIISMAACSGGERLSSADLALEQAINSSIAEFEHKEAIADARGLFVESINKGLINTDSLVMVETITGDGIYQCVAYVYHNQMIAFYNAKKSLENSGEFAKVQVADTPYEALTFLDAIQMNRFENFLTARKKDLPDSEDWWLITFVSKDEDKYSVKKYYSR